MSDEEYWAMWVDATHSSEWSPGGAEWMEELRMYAYGPEPDGFITRKVIMEVLS